MPNSRQANSFRHYQYKQHGAALMVMLVIMVMGSLTFLVGSLSKPGLNIERAKITSNALAQAKEALISYAINSENNTSETQPRPGNLPCPDTDAPGTSGYGDEQGSCAAGAIGRLPWKTLGLPELIDENGEPLWYAVSGNFRRRSMNPNQLNSDTQGTLLVYDNSGTALLTPSGSEAVAIIFSPGAIVGSQQRSSAADKTTASNYLDTSPSPNSRNNAIGPFIAANESGTFNDHLIFITADQLLPPIEKRVAGELKNHLISYYTSWNGYPFAAQFSNPPTASYTGISSPSTYYGLYPFGGINAIGNQPTSPTWNSSPSPLISFDSGITGSISCSIGNGSWTDSRLRCTSTTSTITIPAGVKITINAKLNNVGLGFWKLFDITDTTQVGVRVATSGSTYVRADTLLDKVSGTEFITGSLNYSDGSSTITFTAKGKPGGSTFNRIQIKDIQYQSSPLPSWFAVNNWNEVMYYAVSPGYAPGGGNACNPLPGTPSCLTVNGQGGGNNKRAVVVMPGKALASQAAHPSGTLTNYLEAENATPTNFIYENKTRSSTFNDQVIIVAP